MIEVVSHIVPDHVDAFTYNSRGTTCPSMYRLKPMDAVKCSVKGEKESLPVVPDECLSRISVELSRRSIQSSIDHLKSMMQQRLMAGYVFPSNQVALESFDKSMLRAMSCAKCVSMLSSQRNGTNGSRQMNPTMRASSTYTAILTRRHCGEPWASMVQ